MDKFYPKNFILWRPHLILLLIFLEAIFDCTGSVIGGDEVDNPPAQLRITRSGGYKESCKSENDCRKPDFYCDLERGECHCRNPSKFDTKLHMFYNKNTDRCESAVGKVCTIKDDGLWYITCVPYANCIPEPRLSTNLGLCQCMDRFERTENYLCRPVMDVVQFGVGEGGDGIKTMAQTQAREDIPIEENMLGGGEGNVKEASGTGTEKALLPTSDVDDLNAGIDTGGFQYLWKDNQYQEGWNAASGLRTRECLTMIIICLLILNIIL